MAPTAENLDSEPGFTKDPNTPKLVKGNNEYVYWKECNVFYRETDSEGNTGEWQELPNKKTGKAFVPKNTDFYFSGDEGRVKS